MNSKGHLYISLAKSAIRILSGMLSIVVLSWYPLAIGIILAEVLGVFEELVDER